MVLPSLAMFVTVPNNRPANPSINCPPANRFALPKLPEKLADS